MLLYVDCKFESRARSDSAVEKLRAHLEKIALKQKLRRFTTIADAHLFFSPCDSPRQAAQRAVAFARVVFHDSALPSGVKGRVELRFAAHWDYFRGRLGARKAIVEIAEQSSPVADKLRAQIFPSRLLLSKILAAPAKAAAKGDAIELDPVGEEKTQIELGPLGSLAGLQSLRFVTESRAAVARMPEELRAARETLKRDCASIRVVGGLYEPLAMGDDFIELSLEADHGDPRRRDGHAQLAAYRELAKLAEEKDERTGVVRLHTAQLFERIPYASIVGLPGAGKTTILRRLAWLAIGHDTQSVVLFVECRFFGAAHAKFYRHTDPSAPTTLARTLRLFTAVALFREKSADIDADDLEKLNRATDAVRAAFDQGRLTLLVDALDETTDAGVRHLVRDLVKAVFLVLGTDPRHRDAKPDRKTRCYFSARYSEHHSEPLPGPVHFVNSLGAGQILKLAHRLMGPAQEKKAGELGTHLSQNPVFARLGGTPVTAVLLIFYYDQFEQLGLRYHLYEFLVRFIVGRVWDDELRHREDLSREDARKVLRHLRDDSHLRAFTDTRDALRLLGHVGWLTLTSGEAAHEDRGFTGADLGFAAESIPGFQSGTGRRRAVDAERVGELVSHLEHAHLLLCPGGSEYIFVHSTVMEFLAARHAAEEGWLAKPPVRKADPLQPLLDSPLRGSLEVLPIACTSSWQAGHRILRWLGKAQPGADESVETQVEHLSLSLRCLAETENAELAGSEARRLPQAKRAIEKDIGESGGGKWLYARLCELLIAADDSLADALFSDGASFLPLVRPTLLALVDARKLNEPILAVSALSRRLGLLVPPAAFDRWHHEYRERMHGEVRDAFRSLEQNRLQFDQPGDPEDKNFAHYLRLAEQGRRGGRWRCAGCSVRRISGMRRLCEGWRWRRMGCGRLRRRTMARCESGSWLQGANCSSCGGMKPG